MRPYSTLRNADTDYRVLVLTKWAPCHTSLGTILSEVPRRAFSDALSTDRVCKGNPIISFRTVKDTRASSIIGVIIRIIRASILTKMARVICPITERTNRSTDPGVNITICIVADASRHTETIGFVGSELSRGAVIHAIKTS